MATIGTTQKSGAKQKEGPPLTRSSDQQIRHRPDAINFLHTQKIIPSAASVSSLATLADQLLKHALTLAKPGQQSIMNTPQMDKKTIESIAVLIQHYSKGTVTELVNESVQRAMEGATEQIQRAMREEMAKIRLETVAANTSVVDIAQQVHTSLNKVAEAAPSYSQVTSRGTAGVNPSLIARQAIHARQFLFQTKEGEEFIGLGKDNATIRDAAQKAVEGMGAPADVRVRTISRNERRQELLMEMATEAGGDWLRAEGRMARLEHVLGSKLRDRAYQIIIRFVPVTFNPEIEKEAVLKENHIDDRHLTAIRWIKPIARRHETQRFAHLMMIFNDAAAANDAILRGVKIHGHNLRAEKCRKEALRCHKCHRYNHIAKLCTSEVEICGTCGTEGHSNKDCPDPKKMKCASCGTKDHAAWSRTCPTLIRRNSELDRRVPENALPYFPTHESWTWLYNENRGQASGANAIAPIIMRPKSQWEAKNTRNREAEEEGPRGDTVVSGNGVAGASWGDVDEEEIAEYFRPSEGESTTTPSNGTQSTPITST
ncbi:hypothetical protein D9619_004903 [Psilocybe cf. subviscida]|uniref:CCHC-type domain-containing protein n=1 Tax=Psilocybe cf. subviscida TaxID=2480587 RepID=A0A8H5F996_9AGAR|nr:hypothetical protein D9619_004903 [Psilocybe cf. subviscida]